MACGCRQQRHRVWLLATTPQSVAVGNNATEYGCWCWQQLHRVWLLATMLQSGCCLLAITAFSCGCWQQCHRVWLLPVGNNAMACGCWQQSDGVWLLATNNATECGWRQQRHGVPRRLAVGQTTSWLHQSDAWLHQTDAWLHQCNRENVTECNWINETESKRLWCNGEQTVMM